MTDLRLDKSELTLFGKEIINVKSNLFTLKSSHYMVKIVVDNCHMSWLCYVDFLWNTLSFIFAGSAGGVGCIRMRWWSLAIIITSIILLL